MGRSQILLLASKHIGFDSLRVLEVFDYEEEVKAKEAFHKCKLPNRKLVKTYYG
jgi:hypothetical protein